MDAVIVTTQAYGQFRSYSRSIYRQAKQRDYVDAQLLRDIQDGIGDMISAALAAARSEEATAQQCVGCKNPEVFGPHGRTTTSGHFKDGRFTMWCVNVPSIRKMLESAGAPAAGSTERWIPVSERPKSIGDYLVFIDYKIDNARFSHWEVATYGADKWPPINATHWKELDQPALAGTDTDAAKEGE